MPPSPSIHPSEVLVVFAAWRVQATRGNGNLPRPASTCRADHPSGHALQIRDRFPSRSGTLPPFRDSVRSPLRATNPTISAIDDAFLARPGSASAHSGWTLGQSLGVTGTIRRLQLRFRSPDRSGSGLLASLSLKQSSSGPAGAMSRAITFVLNLGTAANPQQVARALPCRMAIAHRLSPDSLGAFGRLGIGGPGLHPLLIRFASSSVSSNVLSTPSSSDSSTGFPECFSCFSPHTHLLT